MSDVSLLVAFVQREPDNLTAQGALFDALQESGRTPLAARRAVNAITRAAIAARDLELASVAVRAATAKGGRLRQRCRVVAGLGDTLAPVLVVVGDAAPRADGERAHNTFRGSDTRAHSPGAAMARGFRVDYHASTLRVTVGASWVVRELLTRKATR